MAIKGIFGAQSGFNFDILKQRFQGRNSKDTSSVIPPTINQNSKSDPKTSDIAKQFFAAKSASITSPTPPIAKAPPVDTTTATLPPSAGKDEGIKFAGIVTITEPAPAAPTDNVQKLPSTSDDGVLKSAGIVTVNTTSENLGIAKSVQKYDSFEGSALSTIKNKIA